MENNTDTNVVENEKNTVEKDETVKTYTKEDVDNSFNAGFKKAKNGWQKEEDYQAFMEWRKNNQSDSEKMTNLETSNSQLTKENSYLKAQLEISDSDVKKEFRKFVTSEVLELVNDTTDFETAFKNYKKENPQYFGEVVVKKVQSSPVLNGGGNQPQTTNSIMNNLLRNGRN